MLLLDGEVRVMTPGAYLGGERHMVEVIAERIDGDTPNIILRIPEGCREVHMSDVLAEDVMKRIKRALGVLPTSK